MKTKYAKKIFGGVLPLKKIFVTALVRDRTKAGVSPEQLDEIIDMGPEWPRCRDIEKDPSLFTYRFQQRLIMLHIDHDISILTHVPEIEAKIAEYLKPTRFFLRTIERIKKLFGLKTRVDCVVAEFRSEVEYIHGTVWCGDPDDYIRKMLRNTESIANGEPPVEKIKEFHTNMIPPEIYADMHITASIMTEIGDNVSSSQPT